jgi:hypothetical protein
MIVLFCSGLLQLVTRLLRVRSEIICLCDLCLLFRDIAFQLLACLSPITEAIDEHKKAAAAAAAAAEKAKEEADRAVRVSTTAIL